VGLPSTEATVSGPARSLQADLLVDATSLIGESPRWDEVRGRLWWVDVLGREVRWSPLDAPRTVALRRFGSPVGAVALAKSGIAVASGHHVVLVDPEDPADDGRVVWSFEADELTRLNDVGVDPAGRLLVGSMTIDRRRGAARLWSLDAGGKDRVLVDGATLSNGIDFSPDGRTLYWADTGDRVVVSFPYDVETGSIGSGRELVALEEGAGNPDGLTVDAEGAVWLACVRAGEVRRYLPDGRLDLRVVVPTKKVTSVAFAGPGLRLLVMTTAAVELSEVDLAREPYAGSLFACEPGVVGLPCRRFAA